MITDPALKNKLILAHGSIMVFVWLIVVPFAIGANMYARKKGKIWGPKVHMLTMATAALLPFTFSAVLAFTVAGEFKPRPHSVMQILFYLLKINLRAFIGYWGSHHFCTLDSSGFRHYQSPCIQISKKKQLFT
jgi:hypothetical protein